MTHLFELKVVCSVGNFFYCRCSSKIIESLFLGQGNGEFSIFAGNVYHMPGPETAVAQPFAPEYQLRVTDILIFYTGEIFADDWNQQKVSLLEQKETNEATILDQVATALQLPVSVFKTSDETQAINIVTNTVNNSDNATGNHLNYYLTFNPLHKLCRDLLKHDPIAEGNNCFAAEVAGREEVRKKAGRLVKSSTEL